MTNKYIEPATDTRQRLLREAGETERYVREKERQKITSIARNHAWDLERNGLHPKRIKLTPKTAVWLLSDLLWFLYRHTESQPNKASSQDV